MSMVLCLRTGALVSDMHTQGCPLVWHVQPFDMCNDSLLCRDYALIAEEEVELAPGLNVVTGESGAGKSVLVTCLGQLLGAPAVENCIRPPASSALIEGTVHLPANAVVIPCIQICTHVGCICPAARSQACSGWQSIIHWRCHIHLSNGVECTNNCRALLCTYQPRKCLSDEVSCMM